MMTTSSDIGVAAVAVDDDVLFQWDGLSSRETTIVAVIICIELALFVAYVSEHTLSIIILLLVGRTFWVSIYDRTYAPRLVTCSLV